MKIRRDSRMAGLVVLIDGHSRTGKSMLGPILSSFEGVEIERIEPILEIIPQLATFGKLERDAAVALLRQELDMKLYDSTISRMTNFRIGDHTGVLNNAFPLRYFRRLWTTEGAPAVERILRDKPVFQVQTHDTLGHSGLYFDAIGGDLRILEIVRHPVDVVTSFFKRGWGERFGVDPRSFKLTFVHGDACVPWYAQGWEDLYLASSPMDRCIRLVDALTRRAHEAHAALTPERRRQVLFVAFERFISDPWRELRRIEGFIGRKTTSDTARMLRRERVPRPLDLDGRARKDGEIRRLATPEAYVLLAALSADYEGEGRLTLAREAVSA